MATRSGDGGRFPRLRDITGGLRRPVDPEYAAVAGSCRRLDRAERLRIMSRLLPVQNRRFVGRFALMLTLSATIAVMGLVADSVAVVIGAMLIAPLMTPIMTFSAAVGLGLGRRAVQAAFLVVLGAAWVVAFAALLSSLLPDVTIGSEILSRTRPDIRDLVVAVAAGAAGAFATAREDVSAALPGVAVAVALVPPLATTGILLQSSESALAEGSALLFLTNLLAIIVSALVVLLATGVIPTVRLFFRSPRIAFTMMVVIAATVAISIPLTTRSLAVASSTRRQTEVEAQVREWLGPSDLTIDDVTISGTTVTVEVSGLDDPPAAYELARRLVPVLGEDAEAVVRWDQRAQGTARASAPPEEDPVVLARGVIDAWVAGLADQGLQFEVLDVTVDGNEVDVVVSGPVAPPASPSLPDQVADAVGRAVSLNVRWIQEFDPGRQGETPLARLERYVRAWIGPRAGVRFLAASVDGQRVTIDLGVDGRPLGLEVLRDLATAAVTTADTVEIRTIPLTVVQPAPDQLEPPGLD